MLRHILSAVQNSVEEAAIEVAHGANVTTAGWMPYEMPHGFLQRQPRRHRPKPLPFDKLTAWGIQPLTLRGKGYVRADEYNLLAADLTLLLSCYAQAPSNYVISRRVRIRKFCDKHGLSFCRSNLSADAVRDVISAIRHQKVETLLVISLQEEPDDQVLKNEAFKFFGTLLNQVPQKTNAAAPCMEPRTNRINQRYPVYAYLHTRRKRFLSHVEQRAGARIDGALNALTIPARKRQAVRQSVEKEIAAAIQQMQTQSFESLLNLPCFFAGTFRGSCQSLKPAQWEQLFELWVLRATYHALQNPLWWPNRLVPKNVRDLFEQTRRSSLELCSRPKEYGGRPDHPNRHAQRAQREAMVLQVQLFCEAIAGTDLRQERGLRIFLMLTLAGLSPRSEVGKVVNTIAQEKFQVGRDRFRKRFLDLCFSRLILDSSRKAVCQRNETMSREPWNNFKKLGRRIRKQQRRGDSQQSFSRRISNGNQADREDDLFYFVDEFPFVTDYWTPEWLVRFRQEMYELIGNDRDRWAAWLAGAP